MPSRWRCRVRPHGSVPSSVATNTMKFLGFSASEIRRSSPSAKSRFQMRLGRFIARDDAHLHLRLSRASVWAGHVAWWSSGIDYVDVDSSGPVRGFHATLQSGKVAMRLIFGETRALVTVTLDSGPGSTRRSTLQIIVLVSYALKTEWALAVESWCMKPEQISFIIVAQRLVLLTTRRTRTQSRRRGKVSRILLRGAPLCVRYQTPHSSGGTPWNRWSKARGPRGSASARFATFPVKILPRWPAISQVVLGSVLSCAALMCFCIKSFPVFSSIADTTFGASTSAWNVDPSRSRH